MTIIIEDGTGKVDAESYISVADASAYHAARGNTTWATMTTAEMEEALRRATDYMVQVYRSQWAGYRKTTTQALDWPRYEVPIKDQYGYYADDEVPQLVKNACAELAWKAAAGEMAPDIDRKTTSEKVGPLEVHYSESGVQYVQYRAVDNLLYPFIGSGNSGAFRSVVRA